MEISYNVVIFILLFIISGRIRYGACISRKKVHHTILKRQIDLIPVGSESHLITRLPREEPQCLPNEYGGNCTYCVAKDSCEEGHFKCDTRTGSKICLPGYQGNNCRISTKLANYYDVTCPENNCRNGGSCTSGRCCCREGFMGILCEIEIIECKSNSCLNGGICKDLIGKYECLCKSSFKGKNCEIPISSHMQTTPSRDSGCQSKTCLNQGTCLEDTFFTYCLCPTYFTGDQCETYIGSVQQNVCPENYFGTGCQTFCKPQNNCFGHYVCNKANGRKICTSGWDGPSCDVRSLPQRIDPECPQHSCKNDGQCSNSRCCCKHNYTGDNCEIESIGCLSSPCQNNATCRAAGNGFICHCLKNFTGKMCENVIKSATTSIPTNNVIKFSTTMSTSNVMSSITTISGSYPLKPSFTMSTGNIITPGTTMLTSNVITPGTTMLTSNVITPGTTMLTSNVITPGTSMLTSNVITPGTSMLTSNVITPGSSMSPSNVITPGTTISTSNVITPDTTLSTSNDITPITTMSTSNFIKPHTTMPTSKLYLNALTTSSIVSSKSHSSVYESDTQTVTDLSAMPSTQYAATNSQIPLLNHSILSPGKSFLSYNTVKSETSSSTSISSMSVVIKQTTTSSSSFNSFSKLASLISTRGSSLFSSSQSSSAISSSSSTQTPYQLFPTSSLSKQKQAVHNAQTAISHTLPDHMKNSTTLTLKYYPSVQTQPKSSPVLTHTSERSLVSSPSSVRNPSSTAYSPSPLSMFHTPTSFLSPLSSKNQHATTPPVSPLTSTAATDMQHSAVSISPSSVIPSFFTHKSISYLAKNNSKLLNKSYLLSFVSTNVPTLSTSTPFPSTIGFATQSREYNTQSVSLKPSKLLSVYLQSSFTNVAPDPTISFVKTPIQIFSSSKDTTITIAKANTASKPSEIVSSKKQISSDENHISATKVSIEATRTQNSHITATVTISGSIKYMRASTSHSTAHSARDVDIKPSYPTIVLKTFTYPTTEKVSTITVQTHSINVDHTLPTLIETDKSTDSTKGISKAWQIALIVIGSLLFVTAVVFLIVFLSVRQRRKDSRTISHSPADVHHFSKEHFSEQPNIHNPTYEIENDSDDDSVKYDLYVVNE